jgi:hypothetical protein
MKNMNAAGDSHSCYEGVDGGKVIVTEEIE